MRNVFVFLLLCLLTIGSFGCGSGTRPPAEEDTAANPPADMMPPVPGETAEEVK
ncbi:MAG: hypothetical protein ABIP48_01380 [Planctomycetota bacterium]